MQPVDPSADGVAHLVARQQAGGPVQARERRAQVVGDVRDEPPLALDAALHRLGHAVDGIAELRHLVMPAGSDPRVELARRDALGGRRRPPQPQRQPAREQQAHERAERRRRSGGS